MYSKLPRFFIMVALATMISALFPIAASADGGWEAEHHGDSTGTTTSPE